MFDRQYHFTFIQTNTDQNEPYLFEHLYSFKGKERYIVVIQEFIYNFYAVKFYAKAHSNSKRKYNLLTNKNDAQGCIRTVVDIMLSKYTENNGASFGFIGAPLEGESKVNTKRFILYRKVMENFFSPMRFAHYVKPEDSLYLMLNNETLKEKPTFFREIKTLYLSKYQKKQA